MENIKNKTLDHCETVAEELRLNGFQVNVVQRNYTWIIEHDTIAGKMEYSCSEKTTMEDYYRFILHFGMKLQKWALDNKVKEHLKEK